MAQAERAPRGDKPRKIVVCHPDDYATIQRGVTKELGHDDVLVQPSRLVEPGTSYVMDGALLDVKSLFGGAGDRHD